MSVISQPNKKDLEDKPVTNESRKPDVQKDTATKVNMFAVLIIFV